MNNIKYAFVGFCLLGSVSVYGQETPPRGTISEHSEVAENSKTPEDRAVKQTDKLKGQVGLTDEQYKQVYELNLKVNMKIDAIQADETLSEEKKRDFIRGNKTDREAVLNTILTDEQKAKLADIKAEKRQIREQRQQEIKTEDK